MDCQWGRIDAEVGKTCFIYGRPRCYWSVNERNIPKKIRLNPVCIYDYCWHNHTGDHGNIFRENRTNNLYEQELVISMKRAYIIGLLTLIWLLLVAMLLIIAPLSAQSELKVMTDYYAPISLYTFNKNFTETTLKDFMEINIPFKILKGKPKNYNLTTDFTWRMVIDSEGHDRVISVNYTFFLNDKYFNWIREDFVGALKGTFGGGYPPQTISKSEALNVGDNKLTIRVSIDAQANKSSRCYFRLEISNVHVKVKALDLDGDGILDPIDPLPSFNNYIGLPLFGIIGIFPISIKGRQLGKKRR
ncbi:MAG: hypothetical protein QXJ07_02290 [Candidatus Bathyarchaeia archaeon]